MKKKILILFLLLILTGCGKKTKNLTFDGVMTDNYYEDAVGYETVTYEDKKNNLEVVTTPTEDGKKFTASINYKEKELYNIFSKQEYYNVKVYKRNNDMFLELHNDSKTNNINLIVFDMDGNVKRSKSFISGIVFYDDNFIVTEQLLHVEDEKNLCKYYDKETYVSREITYDYVTIEKINTKEIKVKDLCE